MILRNKPAVYLMNAGPVLDVHQVEAIRQIYNGFDNDGFLSAPVIRPTNCPLSGMVCAVLEEIAT
jgi:hypothetical protein